MSLYLAVGLAGYVTFGPEVDPDILNGYPNSPIVLAARLGIAVVVIFSFPMTVFAARISIGTLITTFASICGFSCTPPVDTPPSNACAKLFITEFRPMLTSALFIGATFLVGLLVTDLGVIVALGGASGATIVGFIAPSVCFTLIQKTVPLLQLLILVLSTFLAVFGVVMMCIGIWLGLS